MKFFMGVDCGKYKIHVTVLDFDANIYDKHEIESKEKKDIERQWELKNAFEDFLIDFIEKNNITAQDIILAVENPIYLNNIRTSFDIARTVYSGVEIPSVNIGVFCFGVDNTVWKKAILGNGRAKKEDIAKFVEARWKNNKLEVQDFMDAACIALHQHMLMVGVSNNKAPKKIKK